MNVLVTGSHGQLGTEFQKIATKESAFNWFFTDVDELDICNAADVESFFDKHNIPLHCRPQQYKCCPYQVEELRVLS